MDKIELHNKSLKKGINKALSSDEFEYLRRIGISFDATRVYQLLLNKKQQTASQIADELRLFPSAVYRLCYELEEAKLVRSVPIRPKQFVALNKVLGLKASLENENKLLSNLLSQSIKGVSLSEVDIIIGRQAVYDAYVKHASLAKHDIRLYSIGIAFSEELERTQASARRRGVMIWHAVQQKKPSNYHVIDKWRKLGIKIKYLPKNRGFHFYVIDQSLVCITFSDPDDTQNRLSIVTDNQATIELITANFKAIWREATDIDD